MELKVVNNVEKYELEVIEKLAAFNLVITVENEAEGKKERAEINKLRTSIDNERKEAQKVVKAIYDKFINQVDEKLKVYDEQLDVIENERQAKKKAAIEAYYASLKTDIPLEEIYSEKWLNKGADFIQEIELATKAYEAKQIELAEITVEAVEITTYRIKNLTAEQKAKIEQALTLLGVVWERA